METSDLCMYMCRCHLKHELTRWIYVKCFELSNSIHIFINSTEVSVCQCVNSCNWSKAHWFPHFISLINGSMHVTVATSCLLCFGTVIPIYRFSVSGKCLLHCHAYILLKCIICLVWKSKYNALSIGVHIFIASKIHTLNISTNS